MKVISTIAPYAPFIGKVAEHPVVSGARLNTVMPVKGDLGELIAGLKDKLKGLPLWVDLKCRQIRVDRGHLFKGQDEPIEFQIGDQIVRLDDSKPRAHGTVVSPPWATIKIDHKIKVDLTKGPVKCYFNDGYQTAYLVEIIDGDELIMLNGPKRHVGGGESINILDPSLEIEEYFTDLDLEYLKHATHIMLSYVEQDSDIEEAMEINPDAKLVAKIESPKGIEWVKSSYKKYRSKVQLMAARGDLYVEMGRPDKIIRALKTIIKADPTAICASRILTSLMNNSRPTNSDIMDLCALKQMGYKTVMVGDDICFDENCLLLALDIIKATGEA